MTPDDVLVLCGSSWRVLDRAWTSHAGHNVVRQRNTTLVLEMFCRDCDETLLEIWKAAPDDNRPRPDEDGAL